MKNLFRLAVLTIATTTLTGCPHGGSDNSSDPYFNWAGSVNGDVVKDAKNSNFKVRVADRTVVDDQGEVHTGLTVDTSSAVSLNGVKIGLVGSVKTSSGSTIAAFVCTSGSSMSIIESGSTYAVNCPATSSSGAAATNTSQGSGVITGTPPKTTSVTTAAGSLSGTGITGTPTGASLPDSNYVSINGSANGTTILDGTNNKFRIRGSDGVLVSASGTVLNGTQVNGSTLNLNGVATANVVLVAAPGGGAQVAVFQCTNAGYLNISVGASSYSASCPSSNANSSTSGAARSSPSAPNPIVDYMSNATFNDGFTTYVITILNKGNVSISCSSTIRYQDAAGNVSMNTPTFSGLPVGLAGQLSVGIRGFDGPMTILNDPPTVNCVAS